MFTRTRRIALVAVATLTAAAMLSGCSSAVRTTADAYRLQVKLDPQASRIDAVTTLHCIVPGEPGDSHSTRTATVDLDLNPHLMIREISSSTGHVRRVREIKSKAGDAKPHPRTYRITVPGAPPEFDLTVRYTGTLWQDVEAGEKRGEIHNFTVSAHIGTNGVYLAGGNWYPNIHVDEADDTQPPLARFDLSLAPVEGYTFVASASPVSDAPDDGWLHFTSRYAQTDLSISGGRYRAWERDDSGIHYTILLHPDSGDEETLERRANLFLAAAVGYMRRYVPLVGPYPYERFTIVENFFSSGFAFPTYTLLGPAVIAMENRSLRHGYLDHELLHSWWGNGLYVDPTGGNWCEALTSYAANLYGYVLDGDEVGARKTRRDACNSVTRIPADEDKPLATFGEADGAGRTIGYQKGSMVFHMLARRIGQDNFWKAMRQLTQEYTGHYASWSEIQRVCEQVSGEDLSVFFKQWVYSPGTPKFTLAGASWQQSTQQMTARIRQDGTAFMTDLPLRCHLADDETTDVAAAVHGGLTEWYTQIQGEPSTLELDPEYNVIRKLTGDEILPTIAGSLRGDHAVIVTPADGKLLPGYQTFVDDIREKRKKDTTKTVAEPTAEQLAANTVVLVGTGVRDPQVQDLLRQAKCPITWTDAGFQIGDETYAEPGQAVLCCLRHPLQTDATITIYCGNSADALSNAGILWFYGNSLLVYGTPAVPGVPPPVILREDFEHTQEVPVTAADAAS
ncbi:MAG TPA: M1 family aminopeptidase [Phycisphaerae bacterium]|nr:M1 family aminopeptidase [Phycisphaerae bacterium]